MENNKNTVGIKAFKMEYELKIEKLFLKISFPCQISILWKKG